jgi:hypothetical protein
LKKSSNIIFNNDIIDDRCIQLKYNHYNKVKIAFVSSIGNWLGDTILFPLDTISTRLKASKYANHHPIYFAISTIQSEKLKLFKGVQLTFPATFIPSLLYLTVYDECMNLVSAYIHKHTHHESLKLIFPFFVSSLSQILTLVPYLPVDTVRTRIQVFYN